MLQKKPILKTCFSFGWIFQTKLLSSFFCFLFS